MLKGKLYKLITVLVCVCLLFCSCGKKTDENIPKGTESAITIQMMLPSSLNPLEAENQSVRDALSLCYEPLFVLSDKMMPEGVLARGINISDDCMSAVITLKESVLWHDEVNFTSADVVHTVNLLKANVSSSYYDCVKYIDSIQSIDPLSLKMTFTRPYGQIAYSLYFPIVAAHNPDISENIIGTGPYSLENYSPAALLEMQRFDKWHGGAAVCEKVTVSVVRDGEVATSAFNSGSINTITSNSFDMENSAPRKNALLTEYPSLKYEFIAFNHNSSVFSSAAVRTAVSSAVDRSVIASECYGGAAKAANAPIHPMAQEMAATSVSSQYNLSNAKETLFLEGYSINESTGILQNEKGKKLSFTLLVNKDNQSRIKTAQQLSSQLFLAGIEVNIKELDFETYSSEISKGNYEAYLGGTSLANLYDFEFMLTKGGRLNSFGYSSEYMDAALQTLANAPSADALSTALASFEEVFLREQPVCGLVFRQNTLITAENIIGDFMPQAGAPYINIGNWTIK